MVHAVRQPDDPGVPGGFAVQLRLASTPELEAILVRHSSAGATSRDGEPLIGEIVVYPRLTEAPFGGGAHGLVLELTLWPVTSGLWRICVESSEVQALLRDLLVRHEGIEGWVDHGDGSGDRFWPPP
jgi:hypothetical protein